MQSITNGPSNDRINILEIIGNASMGGMENYIKGFIENLPSDQFRVTCICPYESKFTADLRQLGVEDVFITPIADDPAWRSIQLTVEVAKLHQIDILHAHMPKSHVLAGLAGCLIHKPVVATVHGMNITAFELGINRAVRSNMITNCQEAYTQALAMGVPNEQLDLVRNGVDTTVFTPKRSGESFRKLFNVPLDVPLIGFVGRLEHEKGPDLFMRAAEYVHHIRPDVHFIIVGDGNMLDHLKTMSENMRLQDRMHFVGWWTQTAEIYPALDLLVHTSRSDGTSLVLLEAMSCGCPTIGLSVGGVPEIIENESSGLLVGAGDWEGVGIRIVQLLEKPERLKSMSEAAHTRVKSHFDLKSNMLRTAELLRTLTYTEVKEQRFSENSSIADLSNKVSFETSAVKAN